MFNIEIEKRPSSPVIPSQLSAQVAAEEWFNINDFGVLQDGNRQLWKMNAKYHEYPDPRNALGFLWACTINLRLSAQAEDFVASGVLDPKQDQRFISLLGQDEIVIAMKPREFKECNREELKQRLILELPKLKEELKQADLTMTKRALLVRWLNNKSTFQELT